MNTEELRKIEAFRQRLEVRFQHERRVKRLKVVMGVLVASALAVSLPLVINAQLSHGTPEAAPVTPETQPETPPKTSRTTATTATDSPPAVRQ